jgi:hypothetical protein
LTKWGAENVLHIEEMPNGVLSLSEIPSTDLRLTVDLEKSSVTATGTSNATDTKRTVRKLDERSFETSSVRGPVTSKRTYSVSPDGKTLNLRVTAAGAEGKSRTSTLVYERQ